LGVDTTLVYRGPKILRGFDEELRDHLTEELHKRGIDVVCNAEIATIDKGWGHYHVTLRDGSKVETGRVMYAAGRVPNTKGLGLEPAGVTLGEKGEVVVDAFSRSSVESIYAVGDVTNRVNLTPVAIREGHAFADTVFGKHPVQVDHSNIPTAVFSQPEVGVVGLTETEARAQFSHVDIYKATFGPIKATMSGRDTRVLMKLVVDGSTDRVLGCHIVGDTAAEIIQAVAIAVKMKATKADFDATMALHPTTAEELVTMRTPTARHVREAAE
jgi:glutathione reductase (NADPH)